MSLLGSVGAGEAGVGSPTFLVVCGCRTLQGLPDFLLKDPPVGPTDISHIISGVSAVAVDQWSNHPGHLLGHFVLRTRGLVVGVWLDRQCLLVRLVGVALLQWDSGFSLFSPSPLYM